MVLRDAKANKYSIVDCKCLIHPIFPYLKRSLRALLHIYIQGVLHKINIHTLRLGLYNPIVYNLSFLLYILHQYPRSILFVFNIQFTNSIFIMCCLHSDYNVNNIFKFVASWCRYIYIIFYLMLLINEFNKYITTSL